MRISPDFYQDFDDKIWAVWQNTKPPACSILIYGYDYKEQKWVVFGKEIVEEFLRKNKIIEVFKNENI